MATIDLADAPAAPAPTSAAPPSPSRKKATPPPLAVGARATPPRSPVSPRRRAPASPGGMMLPPSVPSSSAPGSSAPGSSTPSGSGTPPPTAPSPRKASNASLGGRSSPPTRRPLSALAFAGPSLAGSLPKPRSNSSLNSSRPAPPSPANSRPQSQIMIASPGSPHLSPRMSPGLSPGAVSPGADVSASSSGFRDRAGSTASSTSWRSRARPKSTLGATSLVPSQALFEASDSGSSRDPSLGPSETTSLAPPPDIEDQRQRQLSPMVEASESDRASCLSAQSPTITSLAVTLVRRVVVRDYAFPAEDDRFKGLGPHRPYSNWGEGEPEPTPPAAEERDDARSGWPSLSLSWGFLGRRAGAAADVDAEPEADFSLPEPDHTNDEYWSDDEGDDDDEEPDGLYRAAYAFEPEGVNEMAIEDGDLLDVRGRGGGGDGWVIAIRLDTQEEGLVPEGYLEPVTRDDYPEAWEQVHESRLGIRRASGEAEGAEPEAPAAATEATAA
ncbi:hypothetical protein Q8F55_003930 [Vanrija albida]|uniref:SH3 domain-containing protein n=1 Tax=Vanrija albida TaxID=181172 RepID=A0ABR3Q5B7_9TREE